MSPLAHHSCFFHMVIGKCSKFITAPIFYVNAYPHIGHLYTAVLGDTFKRWFELKGISCKYSIGTDEHGLKVQLAALETQQKPLDFCDSVSQRFDYLFKIANISNSAFIRTTDSKHQQVVMKLWNKLTENGYIYKGEHEGWYSVSDEVFVPESLVVQKGGQVYSKETGKSLEWTTEENYKFKLSFFKDRLLDWLQSNENLIYPEIHQQNVIKQLEGGLSDISVSRLASKVSWGIPVPNNDNHVIYVWLDALANYLTAANYPSKEWDKNWPPTLQIVGKDILKFHAIYWPAFLMAAGMELPQKILSHGHWLVSKQKMSKSLGNGVDPLELISKFGEDAIRYFLVRDGHVEIDPEFTQNTVRRRYNHDLAGQLGNIVMRCSSAKINKSGEIPDKLSPGELSKLEISLLEKCESLSGYNY